MKSLELTVKRIIKQEVGATDPRSDHRHGHSNSSLSRPDSDPRREEEPCHEEEKSSPDLRLPNGVVLAHRGNAWSISGQKPQDRLASTTLRDYENRVKTIPALVSRAPVGARVCKFFTDPNGHGCKDGTKCLFWHSKVDNQCFARGSSEHYEDQCDRPGGGKHPATRDRNRVDHADQDINRSAQSGAKSAKSTSLREEILKQLAEAEPAHGQCQALSGRP